MYTRMSFLWEDKLKWLMHTLKGQVEPTRCCCGQHLACSEQSRTDRPVMWSHNWCRQPSSCNDALRNPCLLSLLSAVQSEIQWNRSFWNLMVPKSNHMLWLNHSNVDVAKSEETWMHQSNFYRSDACDSTRASHVQHFQLMTWHVHGHFGHLGHVGHVNRAGRVHVRHGHVHRVHFHCGFFPRMGAGHARHAQHHGLRPGLSHDLLFRAGALRHSASTRDLNSWHLPTYPVNHNVGHQFNQPQFWCLMFEPEWTKFSALRGGL